MKGSIAALFFGLLIIAIGLAWIQTGGTAPAMDGLPTPATTTVSATIPVTLISPTEPPVTTTTPVPAETTIPVMTTVITATTPQPEKPATTDQIQNHFLDIAYSATNKLERLNQTSSQNRISVAVISSAETDCETLSSTIKEFNSLSKTVAISEMVKESSIGDIVIKFLPENGLENVLFDEIPDAGPSADSLTRRVFSYNGKPAAKVMRGTIYINSNLKGDARNHTLARALYYELGVTGETTEYPDSLFYAGENTNTRLNTIDKKAIAVLYEPGLANSMTIEDLRKLIDIP